jgi:hypothetical protein
MANESRSGPMAIASINAASSTSSNWLKEAQDSLAASSAPGGMLGALQDSRGNSASIKTFLAKSQNTLYNLSLIAQNSQVSSGALYAQMANVAAQKRNAEQIALLQKLNPVHSNFNPPAQLDPVIYFDDGSSINTSSNIWTKADGTQIDTTTGQHYVDPKSIVTMANGAYLDTKNNIMTMSDGTKLDTVTGLVVTA